MLRMLHRLRKLQYAFADALIIQGAYFAAIKIIKQYSDTVLPNTLRSSFITATVMIFSIGQFILHKVYDEDVLNKKLFPIKRNVKIIICLLISIFTAEYFLKFINEGHGVGIEVVLVYFVIVTILILLYRMIFWLYFKITHRIKNKKSNILFIGRSIDKEKYGNFLHSHSYLNTSIVEFIKIEEDDDPVSYLKNIKNLAEHVRENIVDEIAISGNLVYNDCVKEQLSICRDMGIIITVLIDIYEELASSTQKMIYTNFPCIKYSDASLNAGQLFVKRVMDMIGSIIGILILFVSFIFIAPLIKLESKGPIFFKQKRVGKNGRQFTIYKYRSMYADAEQRKKEYMDKNEMNGHMFKMKNDPRVTKIGKFIRKTSIDELPQFINVLLGDMSLVGTRPPTVDEVKMYEYRHYKRLSAIPGLTGKWQISGRSDITDFEEIVKMDVDYIVNWTIWEDIRIILSTIKVVLIGKGAK